MRFDGRTFFTASGKALGITASRKGKRWQYRSAEKGFLVASGLEPEEFARDYWCVNDLIRMDLQG